MALRDILPLGKEIVQQQLQAIIGTVASGVADDGSEPVKIGGVVTQAVPGASATGTRRDLWLGANGQIQIGTGTSAGDGVNGLGAWPDPVGSQRVAAVAAMLFNGATFDRPRTPLVFKTLAAVAVTAGTPVAIWTPAAGKKFRLMGFMLTVGGAASAVFKDAATEILRVGPMAAGGPPVSSPPMGNGILSALANNLLNLDLSSGGPFNVSGFVFGTEE